MKPFTPLLKISFAILVAIGIGACSKRGGDAATPERVDYFTCTMHPSVHSKTPGKCPICGMDLVPVLKKISNEPTDQQSPAAGIKSNTSSAAVGDQGSAGSTPAENEARNKPNLFSVPIERQQQIGVTYATVQRRPVQFSIRSVGTLEANRASIFEYVARVDGYVHDLKVASPGERVTKGEPLLTLYSPDLHSSEQELVNLLNERDRAGATPAAVDQLIQSAEERLRLWNVGDQEIASLEKSRRPSNNLVLRSPFDGLVEDVPIKQGASVKAGEELVSVVDLLSLWLWAQFYEDEASFLKVGQALDISIAAFPDRKFQGQIGAIDPRLDSMTRTTRVRIDLDNPQDELRPGMYADVELRVAAGQGLTVPVDAVLPTGSRGLVFVDKGDGKLEPRFVELGRELTEIEDPNQARYYQIKGGLKEGERIVSSANFLIDAESQIQGALRNFEEPDRQPISR